MWADMNIASFHFSLPTTPRIVSFLPDMNIASFHFSLPTTPRIVSFLPPLPLGATPASQMGTQVVQKSQVQRLRLRNADLCCRWNRRWTKYHEWILVTQVTGMKWDTLCDWDCPTTSFVKDQNILMPCESLVNPVSHLEQPEVVLRCPPVPWEV